MRPSSPSPAAGRFWCHHIKSSVYQDTRWKSPDMERVIRGKDFGVRRNTLTKPSWAAGVERHGGGGQTRGKAPFVPRSRSPGPRGSAGGPSQPRNGADLKSRRRKGLGGSRSGGGGGCSLSSRSGAGLSKNRAREPEGTRVLCSPGAGCCPASPRSVSGLPGALSLRGGPSRLSVAEVI